MGKSTNILFNLIDIWAKQNQFYSVMGTVDSVDSSNRTCIVSPSDGSPTLNDVSLEADYDESESKGFYIVPAVGSNVIVTFKSKDYGYLSAWTEIDNIVAKQGKWVFNDGSNGGLTITPELKTQLDKLTARVDGIIDAIKNGVPVAQDGGAALQATQTILLDLIVNKEDFSNIENEDVKH